MQDFSFEILLLLIISFLTLSGLLFLSTQRYDIPKAGEIGERLVARQLKKLHPKRFFVLNDLFFKIGGWTSQIDHVVISRAGLFVIETKTLRGWIHGHENAQYWHQTFYKTRKTFLNPIRQNRGHIVALKKLLRDHPGLPYYPVVVFAGGARLMNVTSQEPVIYLRDLVKIIVNQNEQNITGSEMTAIAQKLQSAQLKDVNSRAFHSQQIKIRKQKQKDLIKKGLCPRCQGTLVKRRGRYGKFYGCSGYPRCTFTLKR